MARAIPTGKLPPALLAELLASLPAPPREVRLPPAVGEDAGVIEVPGGALVVATDPITLTGHGIGAHAVAVNANDVAVMGARPRWFLACVLLPEGTDEPAVRALFGELVAELGRLGVTLVGGHTEITGAVTQPLVVGQMLGLREDGGFVSSGGVRPGDAVLQIGAAPVEGAAVLAAEAGERLAGVPSESLARARRALLEPGISVVEPALRAAALGADALHDPTEGGLSSGLHELASASGVALEVDRDAVLWFAPALELCRALGADPWGVLASGTLLASFAAGRAAEVRARLASEGLSVSVLARAVAGSGVRDESGAALPRFERDELSRVLAGG